MCPLCSDLYGSVVLEVAALIHPVAVIGLNTREADITIDAVMTMDDLTGKSLFSRGHFGNSCCLVSLPL